MQQERRQHPAVRHPWAQHPESQPTEPGERQAAQPRLGQRQAHRGRRGRVQVGPERAAHPDGGRREARGEDQDQHTGDAPGQQQQRSRPGQRTPAERDAQLPRHPPGRQHGGLRGEVAGQRRQHGQGGRDRGGRGTEPGVQPDEQRGRREQRQVDAEEPQRAQREQHHDPHQALRRTVQPGRHGHQEHHGDQGADRPCQTAHAEPPPAAPAGVPGRPAARRAEAGDEEEDAEGLQQPARRRERGHGAQRAVQPHDAVHDGGGGDQPVAEDDADGRHQPERVDAAVPGGAHRLVPAAPARQTSASSVSAAEPGRK